MRNISSDLDTNIHDLDMSRCVFNLDVLSGLLPSVKNLKSFRCLRNIASDPNIISVYDELLTCCKHSFQTLYLQNERKMKGHLRDLTRFQALKEVNADLVLLFGIDEEPHRSLAEVLPMSIDRLRQHPGPRRVACMLQVIPSRLYTRTYIKIAREKVTTWEILPASKHSKS